MALRVEFTSTRAILTSDRPERRAGPLHDLRRVKIEHDRIDRTIGVDNEQNRLIQIGHPVRILDLEHLQCARHDEEYVVW